MKIHFRFLLTFSNKVLLQKDLMSKKGFPISYDWKALANMLQNVTLGIKSETPYYDQSISDISADKKIEINKNTRILIIEGINLLNPNYTFELLIF